MSDPLVLDSAGFPWDERIHDLKRVRNTDGTWRLGRKIDKELIDEVRAEIPPVLPPIEPAPIIKTTVKQKVKTRSQAIGILRSMNTNTDESLPTEELIAIAEQIEPEKWYTIEIQEKEETEKPAAVRVLGKLFQITRGVEAVVPARVVNALKIGVTHVHMQSRDKDPKTGKRRMFVRKKMTELFTVLGEAEPPK
ncbi:MAG: hypothetical protein KAS93_08110 [Gammaproteobacteria bacterium]|nr:hypothetical protein [Gammaproteobacteria bacterium]